MEVNIIKGQGLTHSLCLIIKHYNSYFSDFVLGISFSFDWQYISGVSLFIVGLYSRYFPVGNVKKLWIRVNNLIKINYMRNEIIDYSFGNCALIFKYYNDFYATNLWLMLQFIKIIFVLDLLHPKKLHYYITTKNVT